MLLSERRVARLELFDFILFLAERAHDAHAREVFARGKIHAVHLALHLFVERDAKRHDADDGEREQRDDRDKDERRHPVHRERHDHRAEHDERRAQQQAQRHVDARLHLIDIAGHARDHRRGAHFVDARIGHGLQFIKQTRAQFRRGAHCRLCRKELRRERKRKSRHAECNKDEAARDDIADVAACNADVHDLRNDQGHEKFHHRFAQLEKRRENSFLAVCLQAGKQMLQGSLLISRQTSRRMIPTRAPARQMPRRGAQHITILR